MKLLKAQDEKVVLEIDVSELMMLGEMFSYAKAQYSHLDEGILNLTKEDVASVSASVHDVIRNIKNKR